MLHKTYFCLGHPALLFFDAARNNLHSSLVSLPLDFTKQSEGEEHTIKASHKMNINSHKSRIGEKVCLCTCPSYVFCACYSSSPMQPRQFS